jgi:hypothetical protein
MLVVEWFGAMVMLEGKELTSPHAEKIRRVGGVDLVDHIRIHC